MQPPVHSHSSRSSRRHAVLRLGPLLLAALSGGLATLVACSAPHGEGGDGSDEAAILRGGFRIRTDVTAALNADERWAGASGENVLVSADQPFRIRFELERAAGAAGEGPFRLQARRNHGAWTSVMAADFPYPDEIASPRVSIVSTPAYAHGAATTDLMRGSDLTFVPGSGVSLDSVTTDWSGADAHGEWEWPVVIRRFADGAVMNNQDDVFEFRMVDEAGEAFGGDPVARVTLSVPPGLLGGTYVETPGRLGPWQASNGDLYFVMEPAETWNVLMMVRSSDSGISWQDVDGANRPSTDDLEGFATVGVGERVHMLHQTSDGVWYHVFRTSDDPLAPDTWDVRDEPVAAPGEPPTQVASLAVRADGSVVAVYGAPNGLRYRIRSAAGTWNREVIVDGNAPSGPQLVLGSDNIVHLAYTGGDGGGGRAVWLRRIEADGALGDAEQVAAGIGTGEEDVGSVLPLVFLPDTDCLVILYRLATGELWERRTCRGGSLSDADRVTDLHVVQNAVDSDQVGADAIGFRDEVHVLFIDEESRDLHHARSTGAGHWGPAKPVVEDIHAQWVRGAVVRRRNGTFAYGFVYDAGSNGGSGMNRYGEVPVVDR